MKRKLLIIVTLTILSSGIFADSKNIEVRLLGFVETSLKKNYDHFEEDDMLDNFYGASWEVIINNIGFGGHYGVNFESYNSFDYTNKYSKIWTMDWKGDMFISYHFFGAKSFIDPFIELGVGNAGRTYLNKLEKSYNSYNSYVTNMSLFPYIAAGCSFNLGGLLLGGKINYNHDGMEIPGTNFAPYELNNISITLFAGASI